LEIQAAVSRRRAAGELRVRRQFVQLRVLMLHFAEHGSRLFRSDFDDSAEYFSSVSGGRALPHGRAA
jgi:hypothetical protein